MHALQGLRSAPRRKGGHTRRDAPLRALSPSAGVCRLTPQVSVMALSVRQPGGNQRHTVDNPSVAEEEHAISIEERAVRVSVGVTRREGLRHRARDRSMSTLREVWLLGRVNRVRKRPSISRAHRPARCSANGGMAAARNNPGVSVRACEIETALETVCALQE